MPEKIDSYKSYGQKLISLFAKLLFSGKSYSLSELSRTFSCSKQTILRLIEDIRRSYGVTVEEAMNGNRKYFQIKRPGGRAAPPVNMTEAEMSTLFMCQAFAEHLLGRGIIEDSTRALEKSQALLPQSKAVSPDHFASFKPGSIDYTPHQASIRTLIEAMEKQRICKITYKSTMAESAKTFHIKPLKIFSHRDTIYLHARLARKPSQAYKEPDYDPLLAIHRIQDVKLTERCFEYPTDYDFEEIFNRNFGIIKEEAFRVAVEFTGFAARYVAERMWSTDQKISRIKNGGIRLIFSVSSESELKAWLLSFGEEARLIKPKRLAKAMAATIGRMQEKYN